ncbi:MAG: hypothetical protein AAFQ22_03510 [Pseudomonadota bacterium]
MMSAASMNRRTVWLALALVLALGLTGLRAATAFSNPQPPAQMVGASALEQRLTGLLETVLGQGQVKVHQALRPDESRAFLVMINTQARNADPGDAALTQLLMSAVFVDTVAGDTVTFDRVAFASAPGGLPNRAALLEVFALVSLCILIGAALAVETPVSQLAPNEQSLRQSVTPQDSAPVDRSAAQNLIAQRISEDPARAAQIVRRWLGSRVVDT